MKKTLIVFVLILSFMTSLLPASALDTGVAFFINYPEVLPNAGERFEISIDIFNNPGLCGVQFALSFDTEVLSCKDVRLGELLDSSLSVTNPLGANGAVVAAASVNALTGDKTVAHYEFIALEDVEEFDFTIKEASLIDEKGNTLEFTVLNGKQEQLPIPENPDDSDETEEPKESPFKDAIGHWAEEYIKRAAELELFKGDENGNFNPDDFVTRAQFITVLWRMAGMPDANASVPFEDIENEIDEFKEAISWGYENGYINGTSEKTFAPQSPVTREESMKILHFYSGKASGSETLFTAIYDGLFEDSSEISSWAKPSMYWGIYNELISGTGENELSPKGTAQRAQLAKILVNYIDTYNN